MSSYAEIIFLTAAMMVFSMLAINTSRSYNQSRQTLYRAEAEYRAIAIAQDELDKVQWIYAEEELDPDDGRYIYSDYPKTITYNYGSSDQYSDDFYLYAESEMIEDDGSIRRYQVGVTVVNTTFDPDIFITLNYVKSYSY
tara:strand:+ start:32421 stop:32840 length:420 start_codon:yes stop_codon:yes gene_type:complete